MPENHTLLGIVWLFAVLNQLSLLFLVFSANLLHSFLVLLCLFLGFLKTNK
jgi:hypothetical protein